MFQIYGEGVLTAKWHFMTHYGQCIRQHGPLVNYWCMRYESKHRLAKSVTSTSSKLFYSRHYILLLHKLLV